jgi:hypothetical protein
LDTAMFHVTESHEPNKSFRHHFPCEAFFTFTLESMIDLPLLRVA